MMKKTIFVIGAGANKEINLPTGDELKETISHLLDIEFDFNNQIKGDRLIASALRNSIENVADINVINRKYSEYINCARHISAALPLAISIDNFIDAHKGNEQIILCGKLAIARSILMAERKSLFYITRKNDTCIDFTALNDCWYLPFFQIITENCGKDDLNVRFKSLVFIVFNYDRCLEHFMYFALQRYYGISPEHSADLVRSIEIFHPYGCVGVLPWYKQREYLDFGQEPNTEQLIILSNKIKTFTEGTNPDSSEILSIHKHINTAARLVFIGFAFHKLNMKLITPEIPCAEDYLGPNCFATTYNISENDKIVIKQLIDSLYGSETKTKMANLTCKHFFTEFWRSLSF